MTDLLLFLHLFGLVLLAAGVGIANLAGIKMGTTEDARDIATWIQANHKAEHYAALPGALLLLVTGILLVERTGHAFDEAWVSAAFTLWLVTVLLATFVLGRFVRRVHREALAVLEAGKTSDPALTSLAQSKIGPVLGNLLNVFLIVFLYLMVFKPGS